jgi:HlyD family secretion protein
MIHDLAIHTVGGVVAPGEVLMSIVPEPELSLVELRVPPSEIDQVHLDQATRVKFTSFNQRVTPELLGRVIRISPTSTRDAQTGITYFTVGVRLNCGEPERLGPGNRLIPGILADAYLTTTPRTVMSFLLKPLADNFDRVFSGR